MVRGMPPASQIKDYIQMIHQWVDRKQIPYIYVIINELCELGLLQ